MLTDEDQRSLRLVDRLIGGPLICCRYMRLPFRRRPLFLSLRPVSSSNRRPQKEGNENSRLRERSGLRLSGAASVRQSKKSVMNFKKWPQHAPCFARVLTVRPVGRQVQPGITARRQIGNDLASRGAHCQTKMAVPERKQDVIVTR